MAARRYELDVISRIEGSQCKVLVDDLWPYMLRSDITCPAGLSDMLAEKLERYGVACIPLSQDHISAYTQSVSQYLGRLMHLPPENSLLDMSFVKERLDSSPELLYRNKGQECSRHIHVLTGRTLYGRYCLALKQLFQEIEFLVRCVFSEKSRNIWTTSAEILFQY